MYRQHFAFTAFPFDHTPTADELFESTSLSEASARLQPLLELRGIGLITGEVGSGKTTVCRKVVDGLPTERNRAAAFRVIRAEITRLTLAAKQRPVLIVDEAHPLRNEVNLLTNYQMDSEDRLWLLLVGLTE